MDLVIQKREDEKEPPMPEFDPLTKLQLTPSQRALGKYLFTVLALFVLQVTLGAVVAHYTVEGQEFYGIDISQYFPYSLVRTWHIQAALFWIAMAFLAGGLFLAPIINGGKDPKFQKLGVDVLYWALVVLVVGSFTGSYLAIAHILPEEWSFMFGHQGYEFIDLGRFWQAVKFAGILFWLVLMLRGTVNAFKQPGDKNLLALFFASVIAIGLFYGPALFYGEHTHISVMEYWRWWVVHLWVEGFFEVFSVAALSFIFVSLGLVSRRTATVATITEAALFLIGGIPGTFHHLYFAGATTPIIAVGASFSALEVVPLVLLGHEAWEHWAMQQKNTLDGTPKMASLLLRSRGILEYVRCWRIWFLNQSTNFALLYPRLEHHCRSCSRCIIRCIRFLSIRLRILNCSLFTPRYTI